jgi:hypothetical protein
VLGTEELADGTDRTRVAGLMVLDQPLDALGEPSSSAVTAHHDS